MSVCVVCLPSKAAAAKADAEDAKDVKDANDAKVAKAPDAKGEPAVVGSARRKNDKALLEALAKLQQMAHERNTAGTSATVVKCKNQWRSEKEKRQVWLRL